MTFRSQYPVARSETSEPAVCLGSLHLCSPLHFVSALSQPYVHSELNRAESILGSLALLGFFLLLIPFFLLFLILLTQRGLKPIDAFLLCFGLRLNLLDAFLTFRVLRWRLASPGGLTMHLTLALPQKLLQLQLSGFELLLLFAPHQLQLLLSRSCFGLHLFHLGHAKRAHPLRHFLLFSQLVEKVGFASLNFLIPSASRGGDAVSRLLVPMPRPL
mmetsp:Transcript_14467/g.34406  ORF Transcript_14467/g.34406 Transcript_14467/m.34406 type:complete len:216 (-) Transcript_14467:125-772(-)